MKMKIFVILAAAGLAVAGCSAGKEGQSGTDSMATSTMSDSTNTTTAVPADTAARDTVKPDSVPKP